MKLLLEIKNLSVTAGEKVLLHNVDLTIPEGEVHALLGPNGSGKTSLMMTIMGFSEYEVTQGQILFDGQDIINLSLTDRARLGIGIAQQRPPTVRGVKLKQVLDYTLQTCPNRQAQIQQLALDFHLDPLLDRDLNAGLSGGEIKRSELLQLMAMQPRFAMMDEPDSGIDLESLSLLGQMANQLFTADVYRPVRRRTGLIITHMGTILDYVCADKAHIMLEGRVACSGNPQLILDVVSRSGYEACVACIQAGGETI